MRLTRAKVVSGKVSILTSEQTAKLLEVAHEEIVAALAIGAFAGLRRAELERLDWREVHMAENLIEACADKAKTARRRFIKIQPNLAEWLVLTRRVPARSARRNGCTSSSKTARTLDLLMRHGLTALCGTRSLVTTQRTTGMQGNLLRRWSTPRPPSYSSTTANSSFQRRRHATGRPSHVVMLRAAR